MLVIFDVDDTLLQTVSVAYRKSSRTAELIGLTRPTFDEFCSMYGRYTFEECLQAWHGDIDPQIYSRVYDSLASEIPYQPMTDAAAVLRAVHTAGGEVAIMTNGPGKKTMAKLAAAGIDSGTLRFIRSADNARNLKPSRFAFLDLVSDFGVVPADSTYVSDSPHDGVGARAAGFTFFGVSTGVWSADDFSAVGIPGESICPDLRSVLCNLTTLRP